MTGDPFSGYDSADAIHGEVIEALTYEYVIPPSTYVVWLAILIVLSFIVSTIPRWF